MRSSLGVLTVSEQREQSWATRPRQRRLSRDMHTADRDVNPFGRPPSSAGSP